MSTLSLFFSFVGGKTYLEFTVSTVLDTQVLRERHYMTAGQQNQHCDKRLSLRHTTMFEHQK